MPTCEEVARSALAAVGSSANVVLASQWVSERIAEAAITSRFHFLRDLSSVVIPATINAGLASFTRDSDLVTGDATAQSAWSQNVVGRFVQAFGRTAWYEIVGFDPAAQALHLRTPFSEDSSATTSYRIVQRYAALDPAARTLGTFVFDRFRWPLEGPVPIDRLQQMIPERQFASIGPTIIAELGENAEGTKLVEFYPYSLKTEIIHYTFWRKPKSYGFTETLPGVVDTTILKQGVLVDIMRYEAAMAARDGKVELAAYWRNEYRAQETVWKDRQGLLALADRGADETMLIRAASGFATSRGRDLRSAADEIFSRGNRP